MKKNFMTRVLAVALSAAMALSMATATNLTVAEAAAKPAMKSASFAVRIGNKAKNYYATAATQKAYKIVKAKAGNTDKATAKVVKSGKAVAITAGTKTGKTNITLTFKNRKTAAKKTVKFAGKVLAAKVDAAKIDKIAQKTFTEFEVTMSKDLAAVAAADFAMVRDNDNQVITVKSATLDAKDAKKVTLVVYSSLTDGKDYTVTYTDADKKTSSAKVTVTDGTVADVAITPLEITANVETTIYYQTLDANGVVVSEKKVTASESKVDVTWDSLLGTMNNDTSKYILYNEGDTAKFTVKYHTYKYDATTGAEVGVIEKDFTVTAVKNAQVISQFAYTATVNKPFTWSTVTPKTTIALGDDGTNSDQRTAWFLIKDSKGVNVTDTCGYTVESADNGIVVADGTVKDGAKLSPVAKGSTFLMVKDTDGKVVTTMPITVGDKRTIATFKLSAPTVSISSTAAFDTTPANLMDNSNATAAYSDVTTLDQYGDFIPVDFDKVNKTNNGVAEIALPADGTAVYGTIRVTRVSATGVKGTDTWNITATDKLGKSMTTQLRVNSIEVSGATTYTVVFLNDYGKVVSSIDTTIAEVNDPQATKNLKAVIVEKRSGVVVKACDANTALGVASVTVSKNDGTIVAQAVSGSGMETIKSSAAIDSATILATTITAAAIQNANGKIAPVVSKVAANNTTKNLGVGTYTVSYVLQNAEGKTDKAVASFQVTDHQTAVTAKVNNTACGSETSIAAALKDDENVEYYYGDVKLAPSTVTVNAAKSKITYSNTTTGGKKNATVTNVYVTVPVAGQDYTMDVVVPIGRTFTNNSTWA